MTHAVTPQLALTPMRQVGWGLAYATGRSTDPEAVELRDLNPQLPDTPPGDQWFPVYARVQPS